MPFSPVHIFELLGLYDLAAIIAAAVILAGTILLAWRRRGWPSTLLVIGAVGLLIVMSARFAFVVSFQRGWLQRTSLLQGDVVIPAVSRPVEVSELMSYCLWLGLVWYCVRSVRNRPNQTMQRTAGRSDA